MFQNHFSCIDVDPKYTFGASLVNLCSGLRTLELATDKQTDEHLLKPPLRPLYIDRPTFSINLKK